MDVQLLTQLSGFNPWWRHGADGVQRYNDPSYHRELYDTVQNQFADGNQIVSIVGMRQVGKSTIMRQIIRSLLERGIQSKQILYVSFDDPVLRTQFKQELLLKQVIDVFMDGIRGETIETSSEELYFFFDEIHQLPQWERLLKSYYDRPFQIRYMVSGSSSLQMQKKNTESLLGRIAEYTLYPFSFREYVEFQSAEKEELARLSRAISELRELSQHFMEQLSVKKTYSELERLYHEIAVWDKPYIIGLLKKFIIVGGFPRVWQQHDLASQQRMLWEQHINKVIFQDLPQVARIRKEQDLEFLFVRLAGFNGQEVAVRQLQTDTGIRSRVTLDRYLYYLIKAFLIYRVDRTKSKREIPKRKSGHVKFYMADVAFSNALMKRTDEVFDDPNIMSFIAENLVCTALQRWNPGMRRGEQVSFYKDRSGEIDFLFKYAGVILPVEVKWRNDMPPLKTLDKVCAQWGLEQSFVITKEENVRHEKGRLFVPLWFFLLAF